MMGRQSPFRPEQWYLFRAHRGVSMKVSFQARTIADGFGHIAERVEGRRTLCCGIESDARLL